MRAEDKSARVLRIVNDLAGTTVQQLTPDKLALVGTAAQPAWKEQLLGMEVLYHRQTRTRALEGVEEQLHGRLHLGIRIEDDAILRIMDEADRQHLFELPAPRAAEDPTAQARLQHVQLRFAHRALQAEQQAVVKVPRVVEPVLIEDERVGECAQLEQPMPIGGVARQARDLQAQHYPHASQADFSHQPLEALAIRGARCGLPQIAVDHHDAIERPAQGDGALAQGILALRAFGVLKYLPQRRLSHV